MELKTPTFAEQVKLLKEKNIVVKNPGVCEDFLNRVNYYRFSAYFLPFREKNGICAREISFEQIKNIYEFDQRLRSIIFAVIEHIEIYLRTQFSYEHSHKYGSDGYLSGDNFNKRHNHTEFLKRVHTCISENGKTPIVIHHNQKYNGRFPIWTIADFFSIGMLSHFFRGMKNNDKARIANKLYGITYQDLDSWLRCLTDLRNRCAHYSRLYYWIFPALPKMPRGNTYAPTRRLFAQIYMLKLLSPTDNYWNNHFVNELTALVDEYSNSIDLKHIDFPDNWLKLLYK